MKPMTEPDKGRRLQLATYTIRVVGSDDLRCVVGQVVYTWRCPTRR